MRNLIIILASIVLITSCDKEEKDVKLITSLDYKVMAIKDSYKNIKIYYTDTLITSIVNNVLSSYSIDSLTFYYSDGLLDSAKSIFHHEPDNKTDTSMIYFSKNAESKIVEIVKMEYPCRIKYNDESSNIKIMEVRQYENSQSYSYKDSITYSSTNDFKEIYRFSMHPEKLFVQDYENGVNPYWWISNKIGFPYFTTFAYTGLGSTSLRLSNKLIKKYELIDWITEEREVRENRFIFDEDGRLVEINGTQILYY